MLPTGHFATPNAAGSRLAVVYALRHHPPAFPACRPLRRRSVACCWARVEGCVAFSPADDSQPAPVCKGLDQRPKTAASPCCRSHTLCVRQFLLPVPTLLKLLLSHQPILIAPPSFVCAFAHTVPTTLFTPLAICWRMVCCSHCIWV